MTVIFALQIVRNKEQDQQKSKQGDGTLMTRVTYQLILDYPLVHYYNG